MKMYFKNNITIIIILCCRLIAGDVNGMIKALFSRVQTIIRTSGDFDVN